MRAESPITRWSDLVGRRVAYVEAKLTDEAGQLYATATSTLLVLSQ